MDNDADVHAKHLHRSQCYSCVFCLRFGCRVLCKRDVPHPAAQISPTRAANQVTSSPLNPVFASVPKIGALLIAGTWEKKQIRDSSENELQISTYVLSAVSDHVQHTEHVYFRWLSDDILVYHVSSLIQCSVPNWG